MGIHFDIRGFLEIHAWIGYGFSDQGMLRFKIYGCDNKRSQNLNAFPSFFKDFRRLGENKDSNKPIFGYASALSGWMRPCGKPYDLTRDGR